MKGIFFSRAVYPALPALAIIVLFVFFPGIAPAVSAASFQPAGDRLGEVPGLSRIPELVFRESGDPEVTDALRRSLTGKKWRLAETGPFPEVEVVSRSEKENRIWERPYRAYILELKVSHRGKVLREIRVRNIEMPGTPYQLPLRVFLLLLAAGLLYGFLVAMSLYRSKMAWFFGAFLWLILAAFLAQGYFFPDIFV